MMHSRIQIIFYQRTISYCSEGVDKIISTAHNIIRSENNLENVQFYLFVNNYMHACMLAEREREKERDDDRKSNWIGHLPSNNRQKIMSNEQI